MSKLARNVVKEPTVVQVLQVKQLGTELVVVSFKIEKERYDDIFNVRDNAVLEKLMQTRARHFVKITVTPDGSDEDGHPEITAAELVDNPENAEVEAPADGEASAEA